MQRSPIFYAYFGHHRCASTWISGIIRDLCSDMGLNFKYVHHAKMFNHDLTRFVEENKVDFLAYVTAKRKDVDPLDNFRGFHVIRDPRDISVSAYFSHLHSHAITEYAPRLEEIRNELKRLPKDKGLLTVIEGSRQQFEDMYNWDYSLPHILEVKMESSTQNPYQGFAEIFRFLGLLDETAFTTRKQLSCLLGMIARKLRQKTRGLVPFCGTAREIPIEQLLGKVYKHRFSEKAKGRNPGQEDIKSHYRKGIPGDWVNHFSEEHIQFFKEHYSDLLIKLGYESGYDW